MHVSITSVEIAASIYYRMSLRFFSKYYDLSEMLLHVDVYLFACNLIVGEL